ncbi:MAG: hypothetical protein ACRD26_24305 [Vicinamibacterales bacterium]
MIKIASRAWQPRHTAGTRPRRVHWAFRTLVFQVIDMRTGRLTRTLVVSCLSGLLLGVAARVTMRFVALEARMPVGFSLGGSLEVVAFGAIIGSPVAFVFFALRSRVQARRPWPGLLCGLILFGVLSAVPPPAARSALAATPDTLAATALAFGVLFVAWGLVLEYVTRRFPPSQ